VEINNSGRFFVEGDALFREPLNESAAILVNRSIE
jgi:hypothetical protein